MFQPHADDVMNQKYNISARKKGHILTPSLPLHFVSPPQTLQEIAATAYDARHSLPQVSVGLPSIVRCLYTDVQGRGSRGGGARGAIAPPTFCLKGMNMPVPPP